MWGVRLENPASENSGLFSGCRRLEPNLTTGCVCMLVAPLWCDLGCCYRTVVVLKLRRKPACMGPITGPDRGDGGEMSSISLGGRAKPNLVDRPLSKGKAEVGLSAFCFLFSEMVQYFQTRSNTTQDLERKVDSGIQILQYLSTFFFSGSS